eukprot:scaffold14557_cov39-Phaeocystis_antarctica.AAC.2
MVDVSGGDKVAPSADARPCGPSVLVMLAQTRPAAARHPQAVWSSNADGPGGVKSGRVRSPEWLAAPPLI